MAPSRDEQCEIRFFLSVGIADIMTVPVFLVERIWAFQVVDTTSDRPQILQTSNASNQVLFCNGRELNPENVESVNSKGRLPLRLGPSALAICKEVSPCKSRVGSRFNGSQACRINVEVPKTWG